MLDLVMINETIRELENGDTTFDSCIKLSALYQVRKELELPQSQVEDELDDILPAYRKYIQTKIQYQMGAGSENSVINCIQLLCQEILEFINSLYSSTNGENERHYIEETVKNLYFQYFQKS